MLIPKAFKLICMIPVTAYAQPTLTSNDFVCALNLFNSGSLAADYDKSGALSANDLITFQNLYAAQDPRANCDGSMAPVTGWTDLTAPAGALTFYVASNGNDANPGTQAAPFRTLGRGYEACRAGQPDQVLLRCGDTFTEAIDLTKGSGSANNYLVIGAYGTGPRPRVRSNATPFNGGARNVTGLAIVDLDIAPAGIPDQYATSIWLADGWTNVLIEGCYLAGYQVNLVSHETGTGHITGLKLRRNVIVDSTSYHAGHSGGIFLGSQHGLLLEENVFDRNGRQGEQTIFRHGSYFHDFGSQPGTVIGNLFARNCATGMQVRPGGMVTNNTSLQNAIGFTWGGNGTFGFNVAIDGRDINSIDRRGIAFSLAASGTVEYNVAAYQVSGTDAIVAFNFEGFNSGTVRHNVVWDWGTPSNHGWESAMQWDGGSGTVTVTGNRLTQPTVGMLSRHESRGIGGFAYTANTYYTSTPSGGVGGYLPFSVSSGNGRDWNGWRSVVGGGEVGSTYLTAAPNDPNARVSDYLASIGVAPGSDAIGTFMTLARQQSKQNWDERLTAHVFNAWVRTRFGMPADPL